MSVFRRFAAGAPVPVFVAIGRGAVERVEDLLLDPRIRWVASPRHASVLLVAGAVRRGDRAALRTVHDQLPSPRATLWWGAEPFDELASASTVPLADDPMPQLLALRPGSGRPPRAAEPDLLPDVPPNDWRGVGRSGQGGKGMMGGVPYGRPMAMTAADARDGLQLDESTVQIGPYLQVWPPGLVLELVLQGDVVQRASVVRPPLPPTRGTHDDAPARLRSAARLLDLLQLDGLAERCRRLAAAGQANEVDLAALASAIRRTGAFAAIATGLGACHVAGAESDVRSRLRSWLGAGGASDTSSIEVPPTLDELLAGLEWNEAMLVVNSFAPAQLRALAPRSPTSSGAGDAHEPMDGMAAMEHGH